MTSTHEPPIVILISANSEWRAVQAYYHNPTLFGSPFGGFFKSSLGSRDLYFLKSGWGKISAAASTQWSINEFHPSLLVNLGTCGGIAGQITRGEIVLVEETLVYDIYERMGDADEARQFYSTRLDLSFLREPYPQIVVRGRLLSADQDIDPKMVNTLREEYHAIAADWESGAIAWVAQLNRVPCLILRGVSDLVSETGGEIYTGMEPFHQRSAQIMELLLANLPGWIRCAE